MDSDFLSQLDSILYDIRSLFRKYLIASSPSTRRILISRFIYFSTLIQRDIDSLDDQ